MDDGVPSIETGTAILRSLMYAAGPMRLKAIAAMSGLPAPKTHRYLRSFVRSGLVIQDAKTRQYDLGPLAFSLGALVMQRRNIWAAAENLNRLRAATQTHVSLVVWGASGPIVARSEEGPDDEAVFIPTGNLPVTTSAAGRLFAALLPERMTSDLVNAELPADGAIEFARMLSETRVRRLARVIDGFVPGTSALSAPLLDREGRMIAAVCVLGGSAKLDTSWAGRPALELLRFVDGIGAGARASAYSAMR